ncbi:hypothetical protein C8F01DRAFT_1083109 [Mycena amicta]|nr:hypothetical protein C8F01DRAFT_1083109 [Mycena amicta]
MSVRSKGRAIAGHSGQGRLISAHLLGAVGRLQLVAWTIKSAGNDHRSPTQQAAANAQALHRRRGAPATMSQVPHLLLQASRLKRSRPQDSKFLKALLGRWGDVASRASSPYCRKTSIISSKTVANVLCCAKPRVPSPAHPSACLLPVTYLPRQSRKWKLIGMFIASLWLLYMDLPGITSTCKHRLAMSTSSALQ